MAENSFVLVDLKDDQAKKLAQVISNDTCRKILEYLISHKATETDIAKDLKLPPSTVHYNLNLLKAAKMVRPDEFHYSEKGKEVLHYSLENKYIIIAPKQDKSFLERLKGVLPIAAVGLAMAYMGFFFSKYLSPFGSRMFSSSSKTLSFASPTDVARNMGDVLIDKGASQAANMLPSTLNKLTPDAYNLGVGELQEISSHNATEIVNGTIRETVELVTSHPTPHWLWFAAGVACVLSIIILLKMWKKKV